MPDLQELAERWAWYVGQEQAPDGIRRRVHLVHEDGSDEVLFIHSDGEVRYIERTADSISQQRSLLRESPERVLTLLKACRLDKEQRGYDDVSNLFPEGEAAARQLLLDGGLEAPESGFFETYSTAKEL